MRFDEVPCTMMTVLFGSVVLKNQPERLVCLSKDLKLVGEYGGRIFEGMFEIGVFSAFINELALVAVSRMKKIATTAITLSNCASRTITFCTGSLEPGLLVNPLDIM